MPTRRELESLFGFLQHACRVIRPGRSFLRRMIDLLRVRPHHHVRLNVEFRADLWWWTIFAAKWNRVALFPCASPPSITVTSDASDSGDVVLVARFQFKWPEREQEPPHCPICCSFILCIMGSLLARVACAVTV